MKVDAYLAALDLCELAGKIGCGDCAARIRRGRAAVNRLRQLAESHDAGVVLRSLAEALSEQLDVAECRPRYLSDSRLAVAETYYAFADPYLYHYLEGESDQAPASTPEQ